jgi:hypothetical protein
MVFPMSVLVRSSARARIARARDRLFSIPWHALTLDPENKHFVLDVA